MLDISKATELLRTSAESRSKQQISQLLELTGEIEFFRKIEREFETKEIQKDCCRALVLQEFSSGTEIYPIGAAAENIYFVLEGTVSILSPNHQGNNQNQEESVQLSRELIETITKDTTAFGDLKGAGSLLEVDMNKMK